MVGLLCSVRCVARQTNSIHLNKLKNARQHAAHSIMLSQLWGLSLNVFLISAMIASVIGRCTHGLVFSDLSFLIPLINISCLGVRLFSKLRV